MWQWDIKHYEWPVREDKKTFIKEEEATKMDNQNLQTIFSLKNHQLEHIYLGILPSPIWNPRQELEKGHNGNQNAMIPNFKTIFGKVISRK